VKVCTLVSLNITQVSLSNALVSLFTVSFIFNMEMVVDGSVKKSVVCSLHFTPGLQYAFYTDRSITTAVLYLRFVVFQLCDTDYTVTFRSTTYLLFQT